MKLSQHHQNNYYSNTAIITYIIISSRRTKSTYKIYIIMINNLHLSGISLVRNVKGLSFKPNLHFTDGGNEPLRIGVPCLKITHSPGRR